ncbi:hypothetical protein PAXRUDRAFT_22590 [Paxillus rubicundulus Ve08.2h10]|uniref:Uncharacterized protein n=1 Tax=Paxillus rubicundulus Ve08.2h10 TaxID=930991 RepID=A0A0D0C8N7_9AGAM|nr:hypothetical protein PAXRUDRAFT_22590 [Paxillus rubicundulus Ve08.2h10]
MEGESSLGKRKVDEALKDARERGQPRMRGSSSKMTTPQPMLFTCPVQEAEHRDNIKYEDEDPIGDTAAGSTSSADTMMATLTPALPSTPPRTPIPVPNPAQQRQGH